ncbi:uncharacterized protein Dsimw501_GD27728 [Drosophila simulans]|uniref:Uncharacterized protein n=1 Tax=Drosophila simulans TaxID=7240 RepID=A0A0J9RL06_DROSI|nr:uncharacterized protein Dsimw501_GD27728 [Drosophila simulans]
MYPVYKNTQTLDKITSTPRDIIQGTPSITHTSRWTGGQTCFQSVHQCVPISNIVGRLLINGKRQTLTPKLNNRLYMHHPTTNIFIALGPNPPQWATGSGRMF